MSKADLIDRQATIDALMEHFKRNTTTAIRAKLTVEGVPSAQPELVAQGAYVRGFEQGRTQGMLDAKLQQTCNQLATDTISRQAAIDAVYEAFCYAYCDNCEKNLDEDLCGDCHRKYQNWSASYKTIEKVINALSSAQPEIIRCKDCKNYYPIEKLCGINGEPWKEEDFCSYAERRTDGQTDR